MTLFICIHLIKKLQCCIFERSDWPTSLQFHPESLTVDSTCSVLFFSFLFWSLLKFGCLMQFVISCLLYLQGATVHSTSCIPFPTDHHQLSYDHRQQDRLPWPCSLDDYGPLERLCGCRCCFCGGEQSPLKGQCQMWLGRSIRRELVWRSDALMRTP